MTELRETAPPVMSVMLRPPTLDGAQVELFVAAPDGEGPHPAILFVHGYQDPPRPGGRRDVESGRVARAVAKGFLTAAVSMPGFGNSGGPMDFCGPRTQTAVRAALAHLRGLPMVDAGRVVLWGRSRGAITSGMVATQEPDLAAAALVAGIYDFATAYPTPIPGINELIRQEAGLSPEAFRDRSAFQHAERITMPTLILHGAADERAPASQAQALYDRLQALGAPAELVMLDGEKHGFPFDQEEREVYRFLAAVLERPGRDHSSSNPA